jgi:ribosomal RNA-processing protein 9
MDDFFVNENSIIDPDAKIPKKKRALMVQAAKAFISSRKKRSADSSSEEIDEIDHDASDAETSESETETPAQKRLRLAKRYLAELEEEVGQNDEVDAADLDKDLIASRIRNDAVCFSNLIYSWSLLESCFIQSQRSWSI